MNKTICHCQVCARQIVDYSANSDHIVGGKPHTIMVGGFCCHICAAELDENGMFPEEHSDLDISI